MTLPDRAALETALEATWPALSVAPVGAFLLRDGAGGGRRASAATATEPASDADIDAAVADQRGRGLRPLFRLRPDLHPWDGALDSALAARGLGLLEPTLFYAIPAATLAAAPVPAMKTFPIWPPLAIQRDIWVAAGTGPARLAVMARAEVPKTALLAREADRVAGTCFVARAGPVAMLHALEITPGLRRRGAGGRVTRAAAAWAVAQGAEWLSLAVTEANEAARRLYEGLGMQLAGRYHYRIATGEGPA